MLLSTSLFRQLVGSFPNQMNPLLFARAVHKKIVSPMRFLRLPGLRHTFITSVLLSAAVVPYRRMGNHGSQGKSHEDISKGSIQPQIKYSEEELRERLTEEEYNVTQNKGTERAFSGRYWDIKDDGTYTCVVCGEELFKSDTKFDSGSGWPSFYDVAVQGKVKKIADKSFGMLRVEVVCANCGAHLGHVFDDGPGPTNQRYCINSCSLKFKKQE